ncbi:Arginyl-tRNA--protein transferase 1 [Ptychographa xylographoides]|nr:Arginyl-tRNA--protein transferase 1 [Ptychographa xylographoides]
MQQSPATEGFDSLVSPLGYQKSSCGPILQVIAVKESGTTYYKPDQRHSCCSLYTIRLDGSAFTPRKDQRKAVNRFTDYVLGPEYSSLAARLCPKSRSEKKRRKGAFTLCEAIHEPEYQNIKRPINPRAKKPIEPAHRFEVTLEQDGFTEEKYRLFENYQRMVHKEPSSAISKLDGRLVAMGVLDLTPYCVSSVYLIYHDSVSEWEFGKLSALQEITLALEGGYRYYYMGRLPFQTMTDPENYAWDLLDDDLLARLSARNYVSLSRERKLGITSASTADDTFQEEQQQPEHLLANTDADDTLFHVNMPGILSIGEVTQQVPLEEVRIRLKGEIIDLGILEEWDIEEMTDPQSLQGIVAEFVACIGPELIKKIVVDFDRTNYA